MIIQKRKEKIFDYGLILLLKPAVLVNFNLEFRCLSKRNLQVFIITYLLGSHGHFCENRNRCFSSSTKYSG